MSEKFVADVVVIGGGVIGISAAYHLGVLGKRVLLLERRCVGGGATEKAGGMLAPLEEAESEGPWLRFAMDSYCRFRELLSSLPVPSCAASMKAADESGGLIRIATTEAERLELHERMVWQTCCGLEQHWLDRESLLSIEPRLTEDCVGGLLTEQFAIAPMALCDAMLSSVADKVQVLQADVEALLSDGDRIQGAISSTGERFWADDVVIAGGAWSGQLTEHLGVSIPVYPVRGQILLFQQPTTRPLAHVWWGPGYLIPRQDVFALGATVEEVGFDESITASGVAGLQEALGAMFPSLADEPPIRMWAGLRPQVSDGLPVIGRLPGWRGGWVATGHFRNGVLLAPATGHWLAASISTGEVVPMLQPFSPERFAQPIVNVTQEGGIASP